MHKVKKGLIIESTDLNKLHHKTNYIFYQFQISQNM